MSTTLGLIPDNFPFNLQTRRSVSVNWVACGTSYTETEGTELGGIELQRSSDFFKWGGKGKGVM